MSASWTEIGEQANSAIDKQISRLGQKASWEMVNDSADYNYFLAISLLNAKIDNLGLSDGEIQKLAEQEAMAAMRNR